MIQLVYASTAKVRFTPAELTTLLAAARTRNTSVGLTGLLLHVDGSFLQILEGEPAVVDRLYDRILKDPRHGSAVTLLRREIEARNFPDWSMNFYEGSGRAATIPGYRAQTGFADLEGDPIKVRAIIKDFQGGRWRALAA